MIEPAASAVMLHQPNSQLKRQMKMSTPIRLSATIEFATGLALIVDPQLIARLLLGAGLSASGIAVARIAGFGLLSLGLACWPSGNQPASQAIRALFAYNLLAAIYLGYLRVGAAFVGYLLWPACALHALLALLLTRQVCERASAAKAARANKL